MEPDSAKSNAWPSVISTAPPQNAEEQGGESE